MGTGASKRVGRVTVRPSTVAVSHDIVVVCPDPGVVTVAGVYTEDPVILVKVTTVPASSARV